MTDTVVFFGNIKAKRYNGSGWEYKIKRNDGAETEYLPERNMTRISA